MDLFLAICQGLGLALAIGIGGALAALFVSMMGSLEAGIDPDNTDFSFITATWFLVTLLALTALTVLLRARGVTARLGVSAILAVAGALAFAASLAEDGDTAWPGMIAGAIAAGLAALVSTDVLEGALTRAKGAKDASSTADADDPAADAANVLIIGFAAACIVLAALALFLPPVSLAAAAGLAVLAAGRRRKAGEKYEGLRILR
ncbi:MAG: hypothetical protein H0V25_00130 [Solirubrobacterales bacterium]|nr:hypothetical protein [Solirubrobacterales bacterium]